MAERHQISSHFDINASIVFQLGESLISDEIQALVELVKNAYDADATYVSIEVDTRENLGEGYRFSNVPGHIIVEDNGYGMTEQVIKDGWLTISNRLKLEMKEQQQTTPKGRTPVGDKGLGRLGVQRLGRNIEIFTRPEGENVEYHVAFSWDDFVDASKLSQVKPYFVAVSPAKMRVGTKLVVTGLRNVNVWRGERAVSKLETDLSQLISPFEEIRDFQIASVVEGKRLELAQISEQIRDTAQIRYEIVFDGELFLVKGKTRLDYLRPTGGKSAERKAEEALFQELVESDNGYALMEFLLQDKQAKQFQLKPADEETWFAEYQLERWFTDFDALEVNNEGKENRSVLANPGPFSGEIDFFQLDTESAEKSALDSLSEYRRYVRDLSGIRVFRNGFGVRVGSDWLRLGQYWTRGRSYYGLRPNNTIGYIALTAKDNTQLEETTDREGFKVTPYYDNFYEMLQQFVKFAGEAQEFLRRGWLKYRDQHRKRLAELEDSFATPEDLSLSLKGSFSKAKQQDSPLESISGSFANITQLSNRLAAAEDDPDDLPSVVEIRELIQNTVSDVIPAIEEIKTYFEELSSQEAVSDVLADEIGSMERQLSEFHSMAALGLAAETLLHEINNITDQLALRTNDILSYLTRQKIKDARISTYLEYVLSSISALRKQLAHFSPALKYVREKRDTFPIVQFFEEIKEYYHPRLARKDISIHIKDRQTVGFVLHMNKGKLTQIIDNIVLNSEYWLLEDMRLGHIDKGVIAIELSNPHIRISDNGRGISPSVETSLFEPFVTMKGQGQGRGLGLFVVEQLLDSEGCSISLLPKRNDFNRLYIFDIDLTKALATNE